MSVFLLTTPSQPLAPAGPDHAPSEPLKPIRPSPHAAALFHAIFLLQQHQQASLRSSAFYHGSMMWGSSSHTLDTGPAHPKSRLCVHGGGCSPFSDTQTHDDPVWVATPRGGALVQTPQWTAGLLSSVGHAQGSRQTDINSPLIWPEIMSTGKKKKKQQLSLASITIKQTI